MRAVEFPLFKVFTDKHFGPKEELLCGLQMREVWEERKPGKIEKFLKTQDGNACLTYYYYDQRQDVVYALAGHLVRKGEPRLEEELAIRRYIQEIEAGFY